MRFAGITLAESIGLATENAAGLFILAERYGRLDPGLDADVLVFRWDEGSEITVEQRSPQRGGVPSGPLSAGRGLLSPVISEEK